METLRAPTMANQNKAIPAKTTSKAEWSGAIDRAYINGAAPVIIETMIYEPLRPVAVVLKYILHLFRRYVPNGIYISKNISITH